MLISAIRNPLQEGLQGGTVGTHVLVAGPLGMRASSVMMGLKYGNPLARFKMLEREVRPAGNQCPPSGFDFQVHEVHKVFFFSFPASSFLKPSLS